MMAATDGKQLQGEVRYQEPLARHTSWRVGGPARCFYRPADSDDLVLFLRGLPADEPLLWLGLGSNLLVRDGGFEGTVIATQGRLQELALVTPVCLRVEAGVACARVARLAAKEGLCGLEFLAGIPGTMGGALAMNAGAFGAETWRHVRQVETVDRDGVIRSRGPEDFDIGYRRVRGPANEWFMAALLKGEPGKVEEGRQKIRRLLDRRAETQPTGLASCGSVFRNPDGQFAARLIESIGLKGTCIGGACVSGKHANFIINSGGATAQDIERLIKLVQRRVQSETGVRLETEVKIVGVEMAS